MEASSTCPPSLGQCYGAILRAQNHHRMTYKLTPWFISRWEGHCHFPQQVQRPDPHKGRGCSLWLAASLATRLSSQFRQSSQGHGLKALFWSCEPLSLCCLDLTCCEMDALGHLPPAAALWKLPRWERAARQHLSAQNPLPLWILTLMEKLIVQQTLQGWEQTFVEYLLYVNHCARHFTVHLTLTTSSEVSTVISDSQMGPWSLREGQWLEVTQLGSGGGWKWIKVICCQGRLLPTGLKLIRSTAARATISSVLATRLTCISSLNHSNNPVRSRYYYGSDFTHEETKSQRGAFRVKHCPKVGVWNISPSNLLQLAAPL